MSSGRPASSAAFATAWAPRAVCRRVLERLGDRFRSLPGGKSMHHSFLNGLLMHTLYMARMADFLAGMYPERRPPGA